MVWNGDVRAPIAPIRACFRPRTVRQTAAKRAEIVAEFVAVDVERVERRVGEADAVLIEIVGHRDLAAERVAAAVNVDLVDLVIAGLQQDRNAERGARDAF